jgi:hypothetical protein
MFIGLRDRTLPSGPMAFISCKVILPPALMVLNRVFISEVNLSPDDFFCAHIPLASVKPIVKVVTLKSTSKRKSSASASMICKPTRSLTLRLACPALDPVILATGVGKSSTLKSIRVINLEEPPISAKTLTVALFPWAPGFTVYSPGRFLLMLCGLVMVALTELYDTPPAEMATGFGIPR